MTHTSGDMFGIRTPVKGKPSNSPRNLEEMIPTEGAGSPLDSDGTTKVRRSIGEFEARTTQTQPRSQDPKTRTRAPVTTMEGTSGSQKAKPTDVEAQVSPKPRPKYKDRATEAKACLSKAKSQLDSARNLKGDIKIEVVKAVDRLYTLFKEAEKAREQTPILETLQTSQIDQSSLASQIEEHSKLLKENSRRMGELREAIEKQKEYTDKATYASVAANDSTKSPKRETLHSVVITSTDETETGEEVLDRVRKVVDAKQGWVTVQNVRKARDRKIIMGMRTREDQQKIKERLGVTGNRFVVEEVKNKDPLLILKDVLLLNTDDDVLKALRNQNRNIFGGLDDEEDRVEIKYRRRARNPLAGHIIISTSPKIWRRAVDAGALHIDMQRVRVADQSPLVQCSRCLAYGHGKRFCKETVDLCSHCGGPHLRMKCPEWLADSAPSCKNCSHAKLGNVDRNAFSSDCPTRQRWDKLARSTVAYC